MGYMLLKEPKTPIAELNTNPGCGTSIKIDMIHLFRCEPLGCEYVLIKVWSDIYVSVTQYAHTG